MSAVDGLNLTIGALSRATGVPVNTLRTWERRYGVPSGGRSEGGHRLYPPETVEHVRLVVRALDAGHRPAQVLPASVSTLRALLGDRPRAAAFPDGPVDAWVAATGALDGPGLQRGLAEEAARLGIPAFVETRAIPFLQRLGAAWETGDFGVFHEHFASNRLEAFLAGWWRPLADAGTGAPVLCATLPGDHHNLGLHCAAALLAAQGHRVLFLGLETPVADILDAVRRAGAGSVLLAIGGWAVAPEQALAQLRSGLPPGVGLYVGGRGAPREAEGAVYIPEIPRVTDVLPPP